MANDTQSQFLAAYGVTISDIKSVSADEDSMLIVHTNAEGRDFGIIIEFDAEGVAEMSRYLSGHGVKVDRDVVIEEFGKQAR